MTDSSDHPTVFHQLSILCDKLQGCLTKPYKSFSFVTNIFFIIIFKACFHKVTECKLVHFNWANENKELCAGSCIMGIYRWVVTVSSAWKKLGMQRLKPELEALKHYNIAIMNKNRNSLWNMFVIFTKMSRVQCLYFRSAPSQPILIYKFICCHLSHRRKSAWKYYFFILSLMCCPVTQFWISTKLLIITMMHYNELCTTVCKRHHSVEA